MSSVRAVIDIGTNSTKVLVGRVTGDDVESLYEESIQTRLGEGLYDNNRLLPLAIERTARVLADFCEKARELNSESIRIFATSAARDAENGDDLAKAVRDVSGVDLEIIEGTREAELVCRGVISQGIPDESLFIVDVGGGSTEFIVGHQGRVMASVSLQLGSVRLLSNSHHPDPPGKEGLRACIDWVREFLEANAKPVFADTLSSLPSPLDTVAGAGGTTTFLGLIHLQQDEFDRPRLEAIRFSKAETEALTGRLWTLPLDERQQLVGLPANRADVILFGAAIYLAIMECFDLSHLQVNTRGVRFGGLLAP
ncbi:MAG: hypothetical protein ACPGVU_00340 [Limisphaerales bacterium]